MFNGPGNFDALQLLWVLLTTVLSLINAPGALQFFKKGDVYKRQVFNAKMQCLTLFTMTRRREI